MMLDRGHLNNLHDSYENSIYNNPAGVKSQDFDNLSMLSHDPAMLEDVQSILQADSYLYRDQLLGEKSMNSNKKLPTALERHTRL